LRSTGHTRKDELQEHPVIEKQGKEFAKSSALTAGGNVRGCSALPARLGACCGC